MATASNQLKSMELFLNRDLRPPAVLPACLPRTDGCTPVDLANVMRRSNSFADATGGVELELAENARTTKAQKRDLRRRRQQMTQVRSKEMRSNRTIFLGVFIANPISINIDMTPPRKCTNNFLRCHTQPSFKLTHKVCYKTVFALSGRYKYPRFSHVSQSFCCTAVPVRRPEICFAQFM